MRTKLLWSMVAAVVLSLSFVGCNTNNPDEPRNVDENGALNGKFSISGYKQIQFSRGNLQYQASTNTWRFAEHQWDRVGKDNKNISPTYDGWIDLFGWGTGNNPTLATMTGDDYLIFTDWGINKISNGGNVANLWRTPTKEEWEYVLFTRSNAEKLRSPARVNNTEGYVLLPDKWSLPNELSFVANADNWTTNTYESAAWQKMEASGAVFFPACGFRICENLLGGGGHYASSTQIKENGIEYYYETFLKKDGAEVCRSSIYNASSVRLIKVQ